MPDPWLAPEYLRLSVKGREFVKAYLTAAKGNASQAALMSGYTGKSPNVNGCQTLKRPAVAEAIAVCRPLVNAQERWARNPNKIVVPIISPERIEAIGRKLTPRWRRKDMVRWLEAVAEGVDLDYDPTKHEGRPHPPIDWGTRTKAARMLKEMRGWDPERSVKHRHTGKIVHTPVAGSSSRLGTPVEQYARALPDGELYSQLEELRTRNAIKVPALNAPESATSATIEVPDAQTE
jgi:hypothetical protein